MWSTGNILKNISKAALKSAPISMKFFPIITKYVEIIFNKYGVLYKSPFLSITSQTVIFS